MTCTQYDNSNPFDTLYPGDYHFTVTWDSLSAQGTLGIFRPYRIPFAVTGTDDFASFVLTDLSGRMLCDSAHFPIRNADTAITAYFPAPFSGTPVLHGVRPNGKEVTRVCTSPVTVVNPFHLTVDTLRGVGDQVTGKITNVHDGFYASDSLYAIWKINGNSADTLPWKAPWLKSFTNGGAYALQAILCDTYGNIYPLDTITILIKGHAPAIDRAWFSAPPVMGDTVTFMVSVTDADHDSLHLAAYVNDSSLFSSERFHPYEDTLSLRADLPLRDTGVAAFTLRITDKNGLVSAPYAFTDTIAYTLALPVFPDSSRLVPVGKRVVLSFNDDHLHPGTMYRWQSKALGLDTTTLADSMAVLYTDTATDTITVSGAIFRFTGPMVRYAVTAQNFNYSLSPVAWPAPIQARRWNTFTVAVDPEPAAVEYFWKMFPDTLVDSFKVSADTFQILVHDSIPPFTLSVYAIVNGTDTTNLESGIIKTVLSRPVCRFTSSRYEAKAGTALRCTLTVSDANGRVESIHVLFSGSTDTLNPGTGTVVTRVFTTPDTLTAYCWAFDDDEFRSVVDSARIFITSDKPWFVPAEKDTSVFINDTTVIRVRAESGNGNATINHYYWDIDGNGTWDDTTDTAGMSMLFKKAGVATVYAGCINLFGDTAVERCRITVTVDPGKPVVDSAYTNSMFYYINTRCTVTVVCHDTNGVIKKLHIDTDRDTVAEVSISGTGSKKDTLKSVVIFSNAGTYNLRLWVEDEDAVASEIYTKLPEITVDAGIPVVDSIRPVVLPVYIRDSITYRIYARDDKGVAKYEYSLNGTSWINKGTSETFTLAFPTASRKYIWARVTDNEDTVSLVKKDSVEVLLGAPLVDSISRDTVWVMDSLEYAVWFHDENDTIKSVRITWGDGTAQTRQLAGKKDSVRVWHQYGISRDTTYRCSVTVTDNDSLQAGRQFIVAAFEGKPKVNGVTVDTEINNVFVNDARKYSVSVSDTNGFIRKIYASWSDDSTADDSIVITGNKSSVDTFFTKSFTVSQSGSYTFNFWTRDEDGIVSAIRDFPVTIRLGAPVLWGDSDDTLWLIVDNGYGDYYYKPNYADTNGVIDTFYFGANSSISQATAKYRIDSAAIDINENTVNKGTSRYIWVKDDDGLVRGGRFVVFADSAPPTPSLGSHTISHDSVKFVWENADYKDGDSTKFKILFDTNNPPTTVVKDFGTCKKVGTEFYFWYHPSVSGKYRYKVIAKDARNSESPSVVSTYFDFTKP
jgi:hypothetical protein